MFCFCIDIYYYSLLKCYVYTIIYSYPLNNNKFIKVSERVNLNERRTVPHLSRSDLEDQFYKFKEENYQLKKAAKKQEENLKK